MSLFEKPSVDARLQGIVPIGNTEGDIVCTVTPAEGTKTFEWAFPFDCDFNGIQVFCYNANSGDYIERFETRYFIPPEYAPPIGVWKRYKKFGKFWPLMGGHVQKILLFPTKPKEGIRLIFKAKNTGTEDLKFSLGLYTFVVEAKINTSTGEEGEDW